MRKALSHCFFFPDNIFIEYNLHAIHSLIQFLFLCAHKVVQLPLHALVLCIVVVLVLVFCFILSLAFRNYKVS